LKRKTDEDTTGTAARLGKQKNGYLESGRRERGKTEGKGKREMNGTVSPSPGQGIYVIGRRRKSYKGKIGPWGKKGSHQVPSLQGKLGIESAGVNNHENKSMGGEQVEIIL